MVGPPGQPGSESFSRQDVFCNPRLDCTFFSTVNSPDRVAVDGSNIYWTTTSNVGSSGIWSASK